MSFIKLLWISSILMVGLCGLDNFQQRDIYLGEHDNVCLYRDGSDRIKLIFNLDGIETKIFDADGRTWCQPWGRKYYEQIAPVDFWYYLSEGPEEKIRFNEETKEVYARGMLFEITQKTTIVNPAKIGNKLYNCQILGDGSIQHYGNIFPEYSPAQIVLKCTSIQADTQQPSQ